MQTSKNIEVTKLDSPANGPIEEAENDLVDI